jgi:hypothetical protein
MISCMISYTCNLEVQELAQQRMAQQIVHDNWNDNICIAESAGPS